MSNVYNSITSNKSLRVQNEVIFLVNSLVRTYMSRFLYDPLSKACKHFAILSKDHCVPGSFDVEKSKSQLPDNLRWCWKVSKKMQNVECSPGVAPGEG